MYYTRDDAEYTFEHIIHRLISKLINICEMIYIKLEDKNVLRILEFQNGEFMNRIFVKLVFNSWKFKIADRRLLLWTDQLPY